VEVVKTDTSVHRKTDDTNVVEEVTTVFSSHLKFDDIPGDSFGISSSMRAPIDVHGAKDTGYGVANERGI
jgi:hypothetical protein